MSAFKDLTGLKFNRLLVQSRKGNSGSKWNCLCDCGNTHIAEGSDLKKSAVKSCGCWRRESMAKVSTTHGGSRSSEYLSWQQMHQRCENPKAENYSMYGGRGIKVCKEWKTFEAFIADMGKKPKAGFSIERKNTQLGYFSDNCKWASPKEQANNRRNNVWISFRGFTSTVSTWCKRLNKHDSYLANRRKFWKCSYSDALARCVIEKEAFGFKFSWE